jgi:hypothetical protein
MQIVQEQLTSYGELKIRHTGSLFTPVKSNILCRALNFHRILLQRLSFIYWSPTILNYDSEDYSKIIYKYDFQLSLKY